MIVIVDYGVGNLNSVQNMARKSGIPSEVTSSLEKIVAAKKIILPGVGAFDTAMQKLNDLGLSAVIKERVKYGIPLLGICLGAQLLMESSEEGKLNGLGLIKGSCKKFNAVEIAPLKIPHMGWSDVVFKKKHPLTFFSDIPRFYFVHSYHLVCEDQNNILGTSQHGHEFASAIHRDNIAGVQFHPEKSHRYGAQLLQNFAKL